MGAIIKAPCVQRGSYQSIIVGKELILGFNLVRGIESKVIKALISARERHGDFQTFDDFIENTNIPFEHGFINSGQCFENELTVIKHLLWKAHFLHRKMNPNNQNLLPLDQIQRKDIQLPSLQEQSLEQDFEFFELIGFPLCSPFQLLRRIFPSITQQLTFRAASIKQFTLMAIWYH